MIAFVKYTNMWYYTLANNVSRDHLIMVYNYGVLIMKRWPNYHHDDMVDNLVGIEVKLNLPRKVRKLCMK